METTIGIILYRGRGGVNKDNGKENGNHDNLSEPLNLC